MAVFSSYSTIALTAPKRRSPFLTYSKGAIALDRERGVKGDLVTFYL
ncbi:MULTISPECIES: hypothetical protein [unclassified Microcoleus]